MGWRSYVILFVLLALFMLRTRKYGVGLRILLLAVFLPICFRQSGGS